jgi:hypothetical protein
MDPDDVPFPDAEEIAPHAIAFAQMMFAHAAFEREVRSLQDALTKKSGFGEQRENQWSASDRAANMVQLIVKHQGNDRPETEQIKNLLDDAVGPCRQRNLLAHGAWWCFNRREVVIKVRGGIRGVNSEIPPKNRDYTISDIKELTDKFETIATELYKLRRAFEPQKTEDDAPPEAA